MVAAYLGSIQLHLFGVEFPAPTMLDVYQSLDACFEAIELLPSEVELLLHLTDKSY